MAFTALHQALGLDAQDFSYDMLTQAVEEELEEATQLDWKSGAPLPVQADEEVRLELVKDLAAMGNSGGGVIVYGIQEKKGDRAQAAELLGVSQRLDEAQEKKLRQLGWSMIHPPLQVRWHPVTSPDGGIHLIVAEIPDSPTGPHMITRKGDGGYFGVPWRDGPQTRWMDEPSIAAAYARRFEQERRQQQNMDDRAHAFTQTLTKDPGAVWVSAVAIPYGSTRPPQISIEYEASQAMLSRAWGQSWSTRHPSPREVLQNAPYRYGMRRAVYEHHVDHRDSRGRPTGTQRARAEIHADATMTLAYSRGGFDTADAGGVISSYPPLVTTDIEETLNALLGLMWAAHHTAGTPFDYLVRVSVHLNDRQLFIKSPTGRGNELADLGRLTFFEDLQDVIAMDTSHTQFLTAGTTLQRDAVNQLGTNLLHAPAQDQSRLGAHEPQM